MHRQSLRVHATSDCSRVYCIMRGPKTGRRDFGVVLWYLHNITTSPSPDGTRFCTPSKISAILHNKIFVTFEKLATKWIGCAPFPRPRIGRHQYRTDLHASMRRTASPAEIAEKRRRDAHNCSIENQATYMTRQTSSDKQPDRFRNSRAGH